LGFGDLVIGSGLTASAAKSIAKSQDHQIINPPERRRSTKCDPPAWVHGAVVWGLQFAKRSA
jgi:hypothetical protein